MLSKEMMANMITNHSGEAYDVQKELLIVIELHLYGVFSK